MFNPIKSFLLAAVVALCLFAVGCGDDDDGPGGGPGGGGPDVSVESVSTEDELLVLLEEAIGDGSLDLHRGHQPIEGILVEYLGISHDEMHVRMEEQGQNLAAVAEGLDLDPEELIATLTDAWLPAVQNLEQAGTITAQQADFYAQQLEDAFTFRVNWDGEETAPTVERAS